ncbi:hypothetical protein HOD08_03590 [bacterium]|nr:hypothetical protein [bacterium]
MFSNKFVRVVVPAVIVAALGHTSQLEAQYPRSNLLLSAMRVRNLCFNGHDHETTEPSIDCSRIREKLNDPDCYEHIESYGEPSIRDALDQFLQSSNETTLRRVAAVTREKLIEAAGSFDAYPPSDPHYTWYEPNRIKLIAAMDKALDKIEPWQPCMKNPDYKMTFRADSPYGKRIEFIETIEERLHQLNALINREDAGDDALSFGRYIYDMLHEALFDGVMEGRPLEIYQGGNVMAMFDQAKQIVSLQENWQPIMENEHHEMTFASDSKFQSYTDRKKLVQDMEKSLKEFDEIIEHPEATDDEKEAAKNFSVPLHNALFNGDWRGEYVIQGGGLVLNLLSRANPFITKTKQELDERGFCPVCFESPAHSDLCPAKTKNCAGRYLCAECLSNPLSCPQNKCPNCKLPVAH